MNCVCAGKSLIKSDKEYKIINTWRALPEIDYFIIQKMKDKLDSSAKRLFSDHEPQGSTAAVFESAEILADPPNADVSEDDSQVNAKEHFMTEADASIAEFGVACEEYHENVLHALWREFTKEVHLLNDTASSNAIELEIDPEETVELYFSQLKEEICNLMHAGEIDWEEAGLVMFDEMVAEELNTSGNDDEFDFQMFFEAGLDALLDLFLMADSPMRVDILNALQKRFIVDTSLAEDDAETRIGELLANVSKEIFHSATVTGMTRFAAARTYFENLCQTEGTVNSEIRNDVITKTSPLFRDEDTIEISPLLLPPRSNDALERDPFPDVSSLVPAIDSMESASSLEENDVLSLYADKEIESEGTVTSEHLSGDHYLVKKEDDGTVTTVAESLDERSSCEPSNRKEFCIVVNGTHYTGIESPTGDSLCDIDDNSNDVSSFEGETTKYRNRRLLTQERKSRSLKRIRLAKRSGKHAMHPQLLTTIKEEGNFDVEERSKSEETSSSAASTLQQDESINQNRSWEVERIMKKRTIRYRHTLRVKSRTNSKEV